MQLRFSKFLYIMQTHLDLAEKQVRNLASLATSSAVVPYEPEPGLLPPGEPEPKFVIVNQQRVHLLIEQLESVIAVLRGELQKYAAARAETADYWGKDTVKDGDDR
jgi:hypothetical protein